MAGIPSVMQGMLDDVGPKLKGGTKILSETIRADAKEGDLGTPLGEVAKANPETIIGSYPFIDEKSGPNTNIVVRSRDAAKLAQAKGAVEDMLKTLKAQLASWCRKRILQRNNDVSASLPIWRQRPWPVALMKTSTYWCPNSRRRSTASSTTRAQTGQC